MSESKSSSRLLRLQRRKKYTRVNATAANPITPAAIPPTKAPVDTPDDPLPWELELAGLIAVTELLPGGKLDG